MLIISAKMLERNGSISPSTFYVQLPDYQSHVLALSIQQMNCSCSWCKSRKLGGRGSLRFPCVTPVAESFSTDLLRAMIRQGHIQNPVKHPVQRPRWSYSAKIGNGLNKFTIQKAPPQMFDWIPNARPIGGPVNVMK